MSFGDRFRRDFSSFCPTTPYPHHLQARRPTSRSGAGFIRGVGLMKRGADFVSQNRPEHLSLCGSTSRPRALR
jgi:hypothetical protein